VLELKFASPRHDIPTQHKILGLPGNKGTFPTCSGGAENADSPPGDLSETLRCICSAAFDFARRKTASGISNVVFMDSMFHIYGSGVKDGISHRTGLVSRGE